MRPTSIEDAAASDDAALRSLPWPLDVVVLGMGRRRPHGLVLSRCRQSGNDCSTRPRDRIVLPVHAASAGEPRLTLSLARIIDAGFIALHIEGEDKRTAFDGAMGPGAQKADSRRARRSTQARRGFLGTLIFNVAQVVPADAGGCFRDLA